jgi:SpoVK/Ycf46/Vps4 family AAA+-type ATPase
MIAEETVLPSPAFAAAWDSIKTEAGSKERLVAQSLLSLQLRQNFTFDQMPVHGLILLSGPPGTGKTTLARGLAGQVAGALGGARTRFLQIDPHEMASASLGKSQKEVTRLFQSVIPERAAMGPCIVLLDEVETIAADRQRLSLETNPVDVHRATDAALAGIDLLSRQHRNTLIIATTNFPQAVDRAFISRADVIEDIGLPTDAARQEIIDDALGHLATRWPDMKHLLQHTRSFVVASKGLDGRRLRKAITFAAGTTIDTAKDPGRLQPAQILAALKSAIAGLQIGSVA